MIAEGCISEVRAADDNDEMGHDQGVHELLLPAT
jgi:hypothetical protein